MIFDDAHSAVATQALKLFQEEAATMRERLPHMNHEELCGTVSALLNVQVLTITMLIDFIKKVNEDASRRNTFLR